MHTPTTRQKSATTFTNLPVAGIVDPDVVAQPFFETENERHFDVLIRFETGMKMEENKVGISSFYSRQMTPSSARVSGLESYGKVCNIFWSASVDYVGKTNRIIVLFGMS